MRVPVLLLALAAALLACGGNNVTPIAPPPPASTAPVAPSVPEAAAPEAVAKDYPDAPKRPVVDEYFGTKVTDDYRWLENGADAEVKAWTEAQTKYARAWLDARPDRAAIKKRVTELLSASSPDYFAMSYVAGQFFMLKLEPPKQQPMLVVMKSPDEPDKARVLLDPNTLDASGKTTIDFFEVSRDGKLVAVSLSSGGSESGDVHVYETANGKERTGDVVARVNGGTAGGSVAWNLDSTGFFYTRYPRAGERPAEDMSFYQQVWFHKLGTTPDKDTYSLGKELPRIAETQLKTSPDHRYILASAQNGDSEEYTHWLREPSGAWLRVADAADKVIDCEFGADGSLYLLSRLNAPNGKILKLVPGATQLKNATEVIAGSRSVIDHFRVAKSRLYYAELVGGPSALHVTPLVGTPREGKVVTSIPVLSSVEDIVPLDGDEVLVRVQGYTRPPAWFRYKADDGKKGETPARRTALAQTSPASFDNIDVTMAPAKSDDGTLVPLVLIAKHLQEHEGGTPTLLTGYGGFGIPQRPRFRPILRLWLDQGGLYAVATLRGGGDFGQEWHDQGRLTKKQNVFDDFASCARALIGRNITRPDRLAILGGSNGGLLMGAELTQHPELFHSVVSFVGIYDMLRNELTSNGAFNVVEYGTVKDKAQFDALFGYSPYHHVKDGTAYPPVLFVTGANDPRVDPFHSRKMTARLQAATTSSSKTSPVLLRASADTGHGIGSPLAATIEEQTDAYTFILATLGVAFKEGGQ